MHLHRDQHALFCCLGRKGLVIRQRLHQRLGHQHMAAALDCSTGNLIVHIVGRKHGDHITRGRLLKCHRIGLPVTCHVIAGETVKVDLEIPVDGGHFCLQVCADAWKLCPIRASHQQLTNKTATTEIEHRECDNASAFVGLGLSTVHESGRILAGSNHEHVNGGHNNLSSGSYESVVYSDNWRL